MNKDNYMYGNLDWMSQQMNLPRLVMDKVGDVHETPALQTQVGGGHYKDFPIQPVEFIHKNKLGYIEGAVIKYICRWRNKNGVEDLEKIKHYVDLLIELEAV